MRNAIRAASAAIALAFAASASPAAASDVDWTGYTPAAIDTDDTIWLVRDEDYSQIYSNTTAGRFWVLADHSSDSTTSARKSMILFEVNCVKRMIRQLQTTSYDQHGRVRKSVYVREYESQHPTPGSMIDYAVTYVCTGRNLLAEALRGQ